MIDQNRLSELRNDIGDDSFAEIIQLFCEEIEQAFVQLDTTDRNAAAETLHFIKGSALNIGLVEVGRLCEDAECSLRQGLGVDPSLAKCAYNKARSILLDHVAKPT